MKYVLGFVAIAAIVIVPEVAIPLGVVVGAVLAVKS